MPTTDMKLQMIFIGLAAFVLLAGIFAYFIDNSRLQKASNLLVTSVGSENVVFLDDNAVYAGLNSYGHIQSRGWGVVWLLTPTQMFLKNDTKAVSKSPKTSVGRMVTFLELHIPYKNIQTVSLINNFYSFDIPRLGEQLLLISYTHADGQLEKVALFSDKAEEGIAVLQKYIRPNDQTDSE